MVRNVNFELTCLSDPPSRRWHSRVQFQVQTRLAGLQGGGVASGRLRRSAPLEDVLARVAQEDGEGLGVLALLDQGEVALLRLPFLGVS